VQWLDGGAIPASQLTSDLTADRKDQGMRVLRSTAVILALIMVSAPRTAVGQAQSQPAAVAPEPQEMAAKRAKEREKINNCQKQATEQNILPRDRPQFVINCLDGATERNQPSAIAPEYQELAAKRAKEKERLDNCRDRPASKKFYPAIGRNSSSTAWTSSAAYMPVDKRDEPEANSLQ
jgi:hypothetical protein